MTSNKQLQDLLDQVARGDVDTKTALDQLIQAFSASPYEDLGFARVDHHRAIRQGFPEVILGLGKTPAQIAAIAAEIVARGSTLLVTRASEAAFDAVRLAVPRATYYADAAIIALRQQDVSAGPWHGRRRRGGTSDLPVAEEAARTAELMGNEVSRLYDVGVAGLHRLLGERERLAAARVIIVVAGMEGALPSVDRRPGRRAGDRRAYKHRLWRQLRRSRRPAGHAQQLRDGVSVVNIDNGFGAAGDGFADQPPVMADG
jgi:NCAIR mutase (PurE)-related protein